MDNDWGVFTSAANAAARGDIDGFFVAYESISYLKKLWPDGDTVRKYPVKGGFLALRPKSWMNYGYSSESSFAADIKSQNVTAKTSAGIFSLGPARKIDPNLKILVFGRLQSALTIIEWRCENENEANELKILCYKYFPFGKFDNSKSSWDFAMKEIPRLAISEVFSKWSGLKEEQKITIYILLFILGVCFLFSILTLMNIIPPLLVCVAGIVFMVYLVMNGKSLLP